MVKKMKKQKIALTDFVALFMVSALLLLLCAGCASTLQTGQEETKKFLDKHVGDAIDDDTFLPDKDINKAELPVRFQNPTFLLSESINMNEEKFAIPIGADISSNQGRVILRDIIKKLARLKNMNVSWASDVDQSVLVDVDIRADDDFFITITNLLRQADYFYEIDDNSIIIKYKDTQRFYIAMPFMQASFNTNVGLQAASDSSGQGSFNLANKGHGEDSFDIWGNIEKNLKKILGKEQELSLLDKTKKKKEILAGDKIVAQLKTEKLLSTETTTVAMEGDKKTDFYYTIDKPVGMVTVTAPRSIMTKVKNYFDNFKKHIYRQVTIEAKFVEVKLDADNRTGINWDDLLASDFSFNLDFQRFSREHVTDGKPFSDFLTINNKSFNLVLDIIEDQGHTEILASPKICVLNGQPAMLNVGVKTEYLKSITSEVTDTTTTYSTETDEVMSGIGLAVVATILNEDEVILNLTPITSDVIDWTDPVVGGNALHLPQTSVREMNTLVKVKSGSILVIGGLSNSKSIYNNSGVAGLKNIPGLGKGFRTDGAVSEQKELIILLRPVIHEFKQN